MELIGAQDLDERAAALRVATELVDQGTALRAAVDAEAHEGRARAREAAADALRGPVNPGFERVCRAVALVTMAGAVVWLVVCLINAA